MDDNYEELGRLNPEQKVLIAISMTDTCVSICAEGIRQQYPSISDSELIEKLRVRIEWAKQHR